MPWFTASDSMSQPRGGARARAELRARAPARSRPSRSRARRGCRRRRTGGCSSGSLRLGQPRGDLEDALEHALVLDVVGRVLCDPERERRVAARSPRGRRARRRSGAGRVSGSSTETTPMRMPLRVAQRHEQRVLGPPGVGIVARLDARARSCPRRGLSQSNSPAGHEVRAAALEALVEQRHPGLARRALAHELARPTPRSPTAAAVSMSSKAGR